MAIRFAGAHRTVVPVVAIALTVAIPAVLILTATTRGVALDWGAVVYLSAADTFAASGQLIDFRGDELTTFAPGLSVLVGVPPRALGVAHRASLTHDVTGFQAADKSRLSEHRVSLDLLMPPRLDSRSMKEFTSHPLMRWMGRARRSGRRTLSSPRKLLITMFNVAEWGGLHENVLFTARNLSARGYDVTVACRSGALAARLVLDEIPVHIVRDWSDWAADADHLSGIKWDLVHTHPFASRELGIEIARRVGCPVISTFHGRNLDRLSTWLERADALVAVSRAHAEMLCEVPGVRFSDVTVIPNAVDDDLLNGPIASHRDRIRDGRALVVVASRLDPDKRKLLACLDEVTDTIAAAPHGLAWTVEILGAGRMSHDVAEFIAAQESKSPAIRFELPGWVPFDQVPGRLRKAVLAIASGRGAATSLAVGTPVVAFGSQDIFGLQYGGNLSNGLWGNFGGYPLRTRAISEIAADVDRLFADEPFYARVQTEGRLAVHTRLRQSEADRVVAALSEEVVARRRPSIPRSSESPLRT